MSPNGSEQTAPNDQCPTGSHARTMARIARLIVMASFALILPVAATAENSADMKKSVLLWYEAFNKNRPELVTPVLSDRWLDIPSSPDMPSGPAGLKKTLTQLLTAFPDFKVEIKEVLQDGNKVVVRSLLSGTQRGSFLGYPPSNRAISIQAVDIHEIKDGRILQTWHTEDWMTGLVQLGLVGK